MAALAAVAGLIDLLGEPKIQALTDAWYHAGGNVLAVLIEAYNWYSRYSAGDAAVLPTGLILSLVVVCILLFRGWKGTANRTSSVGVKRGGDHGKSAQWSIKATVFVVR
jgi:uncharacterized membrane protein